MFELPGTDPDSAQPPSPDEGSPSGMRASDLLTAHYQQMEIEYGPFQRRIELSEDVDAARASASYERGLLRVVLPLAERVASETVIVIEVRR